MGGSGSGRTLRWGTRTTTMSQHHIDIRWMKKQNYLFPGKSGMLSWSSRGEKTGSIRYQIEKGRMILNYRIKESGEDWGDVKHAVLFDQTPCNYGGFREWFLCPKCSKRVAILYGAGKYFLCRHCYNLTYNSCNSSPLDRVFDKANNLREKLGGHAGMAYPIPDRPKGMHRKTYNQIRAEIERLEYIGENEMFEKYGFSF